MKRSKKIITLSLLTAALSIGTVVLSTNLAINSAKAEDDYYTMTFKGDSFVSCEADKEYENYYYVSLRTQTTKYDDQHWVFETDKEETQLYDDGNFTFGSSESDPIYSSTGYTFAFITIVFRFYGPGTFKLGYVNYKVDGVENVVNVTATQLEGYDSLHAYVQCDYGSSTFEINEIVIEYYC